jgi:hypothetical protein
MKVKLMVEIKMKGLRTSSEMWGKKISPNFKRQKQMLTTKRKTEQNWRYSKIYDHIWATLCDSGKKPQIKHNTNGLYNITACV